MSAVAFFIKMSKMGYFLASLTLSTEAALDKFGATWILRNELKFCDGNVQDQVLALDMSKGAFIPSPFMTDTP
ncbi:MAG: hypothetical protein SGARI_005835, partial [Bacillariaceae sp.]